MYFSALTTVLCAHGASCGYCICAANIYYIIVNIIADNIFVFIVAHYFTHFNFILIYKITIFNNKNNVINIY